MADQTGLSVPAGLVSPASTQFAISLSACKQLCLDDAACLAVSVHGLACDLFHVVPNTQAGDASDVFSTKTCTAGRAPRLLQNSGRTSPLARCTPNLKTVPILAHECTSVGTRSYLQVLAE